MPVLSKIFPNPVFTNLDVVHEAVNKTANMPNIWAFLHARLERKSFFDDFLYYNKNIDQYIASFGEQFIDLLKNDEIILRSIIESYNKNSFLKSSACNLFEALFASFVKTCNWKHMKCLSNGCGKDPGVYLL